jgi:adenosine kinase
VLIVTGSIAYDYLMEFPGDFSDHILPEHTHNINLSFVVNSFAKRRGGTAGNVSYTLGLLDTPHKLFAYAGSDFEEYKKSFEKLGIDLSSVHINHNDSTSTAFALADKSQNQIWGFYIGAGTHNADLQLKTVTGKTDLVFVGPQGPTSLAFVNQCIELGTPYIFDPGFLLTTISNEDLEHGLKHAAYITCNEYEHTLIKSRIKNLDTLIKSKTLITTLGENGARITTDEKEYTIKPAKAKTVATTAGAGDAWRGGFLAGIQKGFDLQTSGQMGSIAASFAVEHIGTQEHEYNKTEFIQRYTTAFQKPLNL